MKKVLLASTALLLSAGFASAQSIELSGSANAGLKYNSDATVAEGEVNFANEVNMVITGSGTSDTGLEFGAFIDIDEDSVDDAEVFISGTFGTVTVGAIDPASDVFGLADVGFDGIGIDDIAEQYKNATGGADVLYSFSASGFTFNASAEIGDAQSIAASIQYDAGVFSAGIGYIDDVNFDNVAGVGDNSTITVAAGFSQGPISANALYSDWDGGTTAGGQGYGLDVSYDAGVAKITAVYTHSEGVAADAADGLGDAYGVGFSAPLGGGLTIAGGVGIVETDAVADGSKTVADLGFTMSF
ncbi:MAG: porin [Pseudomonadota bacterium]